VAFCNLPFVEKKKRFLFQFLYECGLLSSRKTVPSNFFALAPLFSRNKVVQKRTPPSANFLLKAKQKKSFDNIIHGMGEVYKQKRKRKCLWLYKVEQNN